MIRTGRIRTLLAALLLGSAITVPGLQLAQSAAPQVAHAAAAHQPGNVLGGNWINYTRPVRFSDLQIGAVTTSAPSGGPPVSISYFVNVFDVPANRYVAFGTAAPVPFATADSASFPLTALPTPSRFFFTTITVSLVDDRTVRVDISDYSIFFGHTHSTEFMYRP
jgi:hypothetical protein